MFDVLTALTAVALVVRLGGVARDLLPSPAVLAFLLAVFHAVSVLSRRKWTFSFDWLRAHAFALGLLALCAVAAAVRLPNYASDLGRAPLDIDEHRFAASVKHFFVTGELQHATVEHYPGAVFWLFSAASFLNFLRGLTHGMTTPVSDLPVESFVQAARLANIWTAVATVAFTGLLARRLAGATAGLLSAAVVAVVPLSVDVTTLARNDPGMTLAVVAGTWAALVYFDGRKPAWAIAAAALAGVAGAIKYSAVFALVPVLIAVVAGTPEDRRVRMLLSTFAAFAVVVAVTNHFMWADFPNFLRQLSDQVAITGPGHWAATANPARFYLATLAGPGVGWPLLMLAAGFTAYAVSRRDPRLWIAVSFPVLYLWFMTGRPSQFERWVFPMLPFVAVLGAAALVVVMRVLMTAITSRAYSERVAQVAAAAVLLVVFWTPASRGAIALGRRVHQPTYALVESWMGLHARQGSRVLAGRGWLDLRGAPFTTRRVANLRVALDGGVERLAGCNWVIVPEDLFGHPTLKQLALAERFYARRDIAGNLGIDFEVYSVPDVPVAGACDGPALR